MIREIVDPGLDQQFQLDAPGTTGFTMPHNMTLAEFQVALDVD